MATGAQRNLNRPLCSANAVKFKGFPVGTHEMFIKGLFAQYGTITGFFVNKGTNDTNLGNGFVEYESSDKCDLAIKELNDTIKFDKIINVSKYGRNKQKAEPEIKSIFVENIFGVLDNEISLKQAFMWLGPITATTILRDENGNSKGSGIVYFRNAGDAKRAVALNGTLLSPGRFLKVKLNEPKSESTRENSNLFVKNFKDDIKDEKELMQLFRPYGTITSIKVQRDEQGNSKGFGFVCFENAEDAKRAIDELNDHIFPSGKVLYVAMFQSSYNRNQNNNRRKKTDNQSNKGFAFVCLVAFLILWIWFH